MVEHYRVGVPIRTTLVHDQSARRVFALVDHPGGLSVAELGPEPPELPEGGSIHVLPGAFQNVNWCALDRSVGSFEVYLALRKLSPEQRTLAITAMEEESAKSPQEMVKLFHAVLDGDWFDPAARILARAQASYPEDPGVLTAPVAVLVARRAWPELIEALDALGPSPFQGSSLQHYHHLRATAHAHVGDLDEARRHLTVAESMGPVQCSARLAQLREALDSLPGGADDLSFDRPTGAQLVAVLFAADRRMAEGDTAGAVEVLERPLIWDLREVHSLSRLAAAYLTLLATSPAERFRKALALATFLECVDEDGARGRSEGLAPGQAWPEARIDALRTEAIAWMEAEQGTARGPEWTRER